MTGSMDQSDHTNTNTDNQTEEIHTASAPALHTVAGAQAEADQATDSSIVLDTSTTTCADHSPLADTANPHGTRTRSRPAPANNHNSAATGPSGSSIKAASPATSTATATARPRRSTRFSLPDADETTEAGSSSTPAVQNKGKKRLQLNEEDAGPAKRP
jgi:hypothetical protein